MLRVGTTRRKQFLFGIGCSKIQLGLLTRGYLYKWKVKIHDVEDSGSLHSGDTPHFHLRSLQVLSVISDPQPPSTSHLHVQHSEPVGWSSPWPATWRYAIPWRGCNTSCTAASTRGTATVGGSSVAMGCCCGPRKCWNQKDWPPGRRTSVGDLRWALAKIRWNMAGWLLLVCYVFSFNVSDRSLTLSNRSNPAHTKKKRRMDGWYWFMVGGFNGIPFLYHEWLQIGWFCLGGLMDPSGWQPGLQLPFSSR